jgi:hypothetical protein
VEKANSYRVKNKGDKINSVKAENHTNFEHHEQKQAL